MENVKTFLSAILILQLLKVANFIAKILDCFKRRYFTYWTNNLFAFVIKSQSVIWHIFMITDLDHGLCCEFQWRGCLCRFRSPQRHTGRVKQFHCGSLGVDNWRKVSSSCASICFTVSTLSHLITKSLLQNETKFTFIYKAWLCSSSNYC